MGQSLFSSPSVLEIETVRPESSDSNTTITTTTTITMYKHLLTVCVVALSFLLPCWREGGGCHLRRRSHQDRPRCWREGLHSQPRHSGHRRVFLRRQWIWGLYKCGDERKELEGLC